jgi:hypothetical protein
MKARRRGRQPPRDRWTAGELSILRRLSSPSRIQDFVDALAYRREDDPGSPRRVLEERRANCFDGAIFAAAALRRIGHPARLLDMWAERDDDHVLAVFRSRGHWGAVAKSNFVGLRFREPVYRTLRELAMSYFEDYFNAKGEKTLRAYAGPLSLAQFDELRWTFEDTHLQYISGRLDALRHHRILTPAMKRALTRVDPLSLKAGMLGADPAGVYKA